MMHFQYQLLNPFGPNILKAKCPQFILNEVNKFVDGPESRSVSPDLLDRTIDVVYLTEEFCESIQLKTFVEERVSFITNNFLLILTNFVSHWFLQVMNDLMGKQSCPMPG